jgi:heme/copper-type cytochrome/quinol oxidase subunit 3
MEMSTARLGKWLFIASDAATFAALLLSYFYLRESATTPVHASSGAVMTVVLLASSLTMLLAVKSANRVRYTLLTAAGGVLFLILHLNEWRGLFREGVALATNAPFFTLTGLHMTHVAAGVFCLALVRARPTVEVIALYWYFVDAVWLFIFPVLYLT